MSGPWSDNETILQFGAGNFLRAFADLIIHQVNGDPATAVGRIVVVQSTGLDRAAALNRCGGAYHVALQGFRNGQVVNETERVASIRRALHAGTQWPEVLAFAVRPELRWIISNTTEAGFTLDPADQDRDGSVPKSFPAKLLAVLLARYEAGASGVGIIPCELIEANASKLCRLVLEQAERWKVSAKARAWIEQACTWVENLVDRIVPGPPREHELLGTDPLLLSAEPFAFWGVQTRNPFLLHPAVLACDDLRPYYLRKVRLLNGAHTALVAHALPRGFKTVRACLEDREMEQWLQRVLFEEIVPVLEGRVDDPAEFARATLDRFRNPFLEHALSSIALNHTAKVAVRLLPTIEEYHARFGRRPPLLSAALDQSIS